ncbi:hypothetical protein A5787_12940 [Mycobacterium sp. 852002-50816_SCH5313054-b]|uniref:DUF732 domain-containing protein n=1 Tax=Mycobacterium sp. 852002-50816_SCH5313054-b TaxID=1834092 RepID=UPI000800C5E2|nr:DUF732 domain-containing protein [Mycobacterium sp. 852002-50816_SCH5313054-b]OBF44707.1 hypothetical protein A5787_12940 [Mycobacterium sp. 852002-50816_SCH5313054-b]
MTHSRVGRGTRSAFAAALLSGAALLAAAPASADQLDDAFIAALVNQGLPVPDNDAAIQEGRTMCALLDQGTTRPLLVMRLMRDTNLTARQAGFFLGISSSAYCPQYRTTVSG